LALERTNTQLIQITGGIYSGKAWSPMSTLSSVLKLKRGSYTFDGDAPKLMATREAFEDSAKSLTFQLGSRADVTLKIGLPGGFYVSGTVSGSIQPSGGPFAYSDLPQPEQDALWSQACENALQIDRVTYESLHGHNQPAVPQTTATGKPTANP
jgi:hypothetical protein